VDDTRHRMLGGRVEDLVRFEVRCWIAIAPLLQPTREGAAGDENGELCSSAG
jgi:hypothetical protein